MMFHFKRSMDPVLKHKDNLSYFPQDPPDSAHVVFPQLNHPQVSNLDFSYLFPFSLWEVSLIFALMFIL